MRVYLDYNASAPIEDEVKKYVFEVMDNVGNPSSIHSSGREAKKILELARERVARKVNADSKDVIFTSGATEANNLALNGFKNIITSKIEHESVYNNGNVNLVNVNKFGYIKLDDLENKMKLFQSKDDTVVSVMFANNETGIMQPIKEIGQLTKKYKIPFHTDAVQAFGRIPIDIKNLGCDMITLSSHKIGGPHGAGALIVGDKKIVNSFMVGGNQENNARAGTEPLIAIAGFGYAAELANIEKIRNLKKVRDYFEEKLLNTNLDIKIVGKKSERLPNTSMFCFSSIKSESLLIALDIEGFDVSSGSACSSGQVEESKTLIAMGLEKKLASCAIRVSFGPKNTRKEVDKLVEKIIKINDRFKRVA